MLSGRAFVSFIAGGDSWRDVIGLAGATRLSRCVRLFRYLPASISGLRRRIIAYHGHVATQSFI